MKLIRNLIEVKLLKAIKTKASNGTYIKTFNYINSYNIEKQDLTDEVSATIYGASIDKMLRISSPLNDLEKYLIPKVENEADNISLYYIQIGNVKYKINSVKESGITLERDGIIENEVSL